MGEVYEARDTRLGRTVAIKVLPEWIASNAEIRARFEREARAVSQISHSNVCTLHDIGEAENVHFLVLEHCRGETLGERLEKGALPLSDVLRYGAQIADALDAAHRRGVVHRDLKPANVMITSSGAKLLDFGLARLAAREGDGVGEDLPTMVQGSEGVKTEEGTVLGTFPYMSPEQVEGREVDTRSDVFSLGAVLYEMATGERAFPGGSAASVMAAVLKEDPAPLSQSLTVTPPALEHVIDRCLAKDAENRWQSARDVAAELRWIAESGPAPSAAEMDVAPTSRRERWMWGGVVVLLALALLGLWLTSPAPDEAESVEFQIPVRQDSRVTSLAVAPDGGALVTAQVRHGESRLLLHRFDRLDPEPILGTEGGSRPFFSPDGRWIGFLAEDELRKVPLSGGTPITLCPADRITGADWGEDGTIVFSNAPPSGLWRVPADGGEPVAVTEIREDRAEDREDLHFAPHLLPGGDLLFTRWSAGSRIQYSVAVLPAGETEPRSLVQGIASGYDRDGYLLYGDPDQRVLNAVPFDAGELELTGDPVVVAPDVELSQSSLASLAAGTLAYQTSLQPPRRLVWIDPEGGRSEIALPQEIYAQARLSPDGHRVALVTASKDGTEAEIWIGDLDRGTMTRVTHDVAGDWNPLWSPDGSTLFFDSDRNGPPDIYRVPAHGGDPEELVADPRAVLRPWAFTPEGEGVLFTERFVGPGEQERPVASVRRLDLVTGETETLFTSPALTLSLDLSPDGRRLAYLSNETGRFEVYVRTYPELDQTRRVSTGGDKMAPRWSADGSRLYYVQGGALMSIPVGRGAEMELGRPSRVVDFSLVDRFDVAPDGRILTLEYTAEVGGRLVVALNWSRRMEASKP